MTGLAEAAIAGMRRAGLRPTRQRRQLANLLFADTTEAVTAEGLHALATRNGIKVSLATVYGTLNSFCEVGLVRDIAVDSKRYFDTNPDNQQYFFYEEEKRLVAVSAEKTGFTGTPPAPEGLMVARVDLIVRLRKDEPGRRH